MLVPSWKETHCNYITRICQLVAVRKTTPVYPGNQLKPINSLRGQTLEPLNIKAGDTDSRHEYTCISFMLFAKNDSRIMKVETATYDMRTICYVVPS